MFAFEKQAAINFIRQNQDVAVADDLGNLLHIFALHHTAGGIMRGIQDNQLRTISGEGCEFVDIEREIAFFAQVDWYGLAANVVDHRLVDRETGVGINDLIAFIYERQDSNENTRFTSRPATHLLHGTSS